MPWLRLMRRLLALDFGGVMISTSPRRNTDLLTVSFLRLKSRVDQFSVQSSPTHRPEEITARTTRNSRILLADESAW